MMPDKKQLLFQKETSYGLVEVWQKNNKRWLTVDAIEQSSIYPDRPDQLLSPLHQTFLATLLFIDKPEKILLAGMGGGALARYVSYIDPAIRGDAVEINETVAALAKKFFEFPEAQWNININNIQQWQGEAYDLIITDIAEADLTPSWLTSEVMLSQFKKQLSSQGVLVVNLLVNDASSFSQALSTVRKIFERRTLCLAVPTYKNVVIFAFNQSPKYSSKKELRSRVKHLTKIWGLDFNILLEQLEKDNPLGSGVF